MNTRYVVCNPRWNRVRIHRVDCNEYTNRMPGTTSWSNLFDTKEAAQAYADGLGRPDTGDCAICLPLRD